MNPDSSPPTYGSLKDLTASGKPIANRLGNAEQAWDVCSRLLQNDMLRARRRVTVQANIDGVAPKTKGQLKAAGREDDANINWREGKGQILNAWTPYYDLVCEVPVCIDGELDEFDPTTNQELMRAFAEEFHKMVFGWDGYDYMTHLRDLQMLVHGVGNLVYTDSQNWKPEPILASNFYVPDKMRLDMTNGEMFMVTGEIAAGELYQKLESKNPAWNAELVKKTIIESYAGNDNSMLQWKWDRWEQMLKNGDIWVSQTQTKIIQVCMIWVKEMDGKISMHIIQNGLKAAPTGYLYSKIGEFKNWNECLTQFSFDVGSDGTYHSVKGLGTEIYPYCALWNKINNDMADVISTGIKPMFQPATANDGQKYQMLKYGGMNIIPPGLNEITSQALGNLGAANEVAEAFRRNLGRNTGVYHEDTAAPTVDETAKAAMIRASERAKLSKGSYNRHYRSLDRMYREMFRRATNPDVKEYWPGSKEALEFQEACRKICEKHDVPFECLQKVRNVRANRSIGLGSAAMRIEIANAVMAQYPLLDPVGQNNALRMYFSALMGYQSVDSLVRPIEQGAIPVEDDSIAALENTALNTDGEVVITPQQNHEIHLNHHIPSMEADAFACQNGQQDPKECFMRLDAKGVHAHEHVAELAKNPTKQQQVKGFNERLRVLSSFQDKLQQNLEEQANAEAQQPQPGQPDPEMVKVQGNLELKKLKMQGDLQLKAQRQAIDLELKARQQAADTALKAAQTKADITMSDAQTSADIRRKHVETTAKVNNAAKKPEPEAASE